jgi:hypothetical protein
MNRIPPIIKEDKSDYDGPYELKRTKQINFIPTWVRNQMQQDYQDISKKIPVSPQALRYELERLNSNL